MFKVNSSKILTLIAERGLTIRSFAVTCGITTTTAKKIISGDQPISLKVLSAISNFFNTDPNTLILSETKE